jgi:hypothetical protein
MPEWLSDSRRLLVATLQGQLYLIDSQSKKLQQILSVAPRVIRSLSVSKDDRLIYFDIENHRSRHLADDLGCRSPTVSKTSDARIMPA